MHQLIIIILKNNNKKKKIRFLNKNYLEDLT